MRNEELNPIYCCPVNPKAEGLGEVSGLEVSQPHGDYASSVIGVGLMNQVSNLGLVEGHHVASVKQLKAHCSKLKIFKQNN